MRIGLVAQDEPRHQARLDAAEAHLRKRRGADVAVKTGKDAANADALVLFGADHFLLDRLALLNDPVPLLLVGEGFLAETDGENLEEVMGHVAKGDFWVEKRLRLESTLDGKALSPALNEVTVCTSRGAGFLRYTLTVDEEVVWRDGGDGVVVSTPTGSTGYGLSAGGPIVVENADAIVVVPICSANHHRPLVLNEAAVVEVSEVNSTLGCDVVTDGRERVPIKGHTLRVRQAKEPAQFIRFGKAQYFRIFGKLRERSAGLVLPPGSPPSAKFLYKLLSFEGPMNQKELIAESGLPERTVRNALSYLIEQGVVVRYTTLRDTRRAIYGLKKE